MIDAFFQFRRKQPIVISYCAEVLTAPAASGIDDKNGTVKTCAGHAGLIIGKGRMADGRCGYQIRNSWGTDPDGVENGDTKGNVWVAEDNLYRNLIEMDVLPPRGETYVPPQDLYSGIPAAAVDGGKMKNQDKEREGGARHESFFRGAFSYPSELSLAELTLAELGGTVVWSQDSQGNERTFCRFKDGSWVGSGSLAYYGRRNSK